MKLSTSACSVYGWEGRGVCSLNPGYVTRCLSAAGSLEDARPAKSSGQERKLRERSPRVLEPSAAPGERRPGSFASIDGRITMPTLQLRP